MFNPASLAAKHNRSTAIRQVDISHGLALDEQNDLQPIRVHVSAPSLLGKIEEISVLFIPDWTYLHQFVHTALTTLGLDPVRWQLRDPDDKILDSRCVQSRPIHTEGRYRNGDVFTAHSSVPWIWKHPPEKSDGHWYRYEQWQSDQLEHAYAIKKEDSVVLLHMEVPLRMPYTRNVVFKERNELKHSPSGEVLGVKLVHRGILWQFLDKVWYPFGWEDSDKLEFFMSELNGGPFYSSNNSPDRIGSPTFNNVHWRVVLNSEDKQTYAVDFDKMTISGAISPTRCIKRQTDMIEQSRSIRKKKQIKTTQLRSMGHLCCANLTIAHQADLRPLR